MAAERTEWTEYPEKEAGRMVWQEGDATCSVVLTDMGHPCGYCRFPKRPVREEGYNGILTYVPVHGGITYARQSEDGSMVYGFDCAHVNSPPSPSLDWLKEQCRGMAHAIREARPFEVRYLRCKTNKGKARAIDDFLEAIGSTAQALDGNFGMMINVLCGKL